MKIVTRGFDPLAVFVDGVETPVLETAYLDEDGKNQTISYVVVSGVKYPIRHRIEIYEKLVEKSMDETLVAVEIKRLENVEIKKIEDAKLENPSEEIKP